MKKILLSLLIIILISSCNKKEATEETTDTTEIVVNDDSIIINNDTIEISSDTLDMLEELQTPEDKQRFWSSDETNLPKGVVIQSDCENCINSNNKKPKNLKNNYVTIKQLNGNLTIRRDIEEDLYLNLRDGDIIR